MKTIAELNLLVRDVATFLQASEMRICTAESCTGGFLSQVLTSLPGSSVWFDCGWVTYSNTAKTQLLHVPSQMIEAKGAVSEAVAVAMAQGALDLSSADLAIAITGIAGPSGGTQDKPVGTVWLAWQLRQRDVITRCEQFSGDRDAVRLQAVMTALAMVLKMKLN